MRPLEDQEVVLQMVLGTAMRHLRRQRRTGELVAPLPSLGSAGHIFMNLRQKPPDYNQVYRVLKATRNYAEGDSPLKREMRALLDRRSKSWSRELTGMEEKANVGQAMLEKIKAAYVQLGYDNVAESLRLSQYKPSTDRRPVPLIFVYIDQSLIGLLYGQKHARRQQVEQQLNVKIYLERDQEGRQRPRRH